VAVWKAGLLLTLFSAFLSTNAAGQPASPGSRNRDLPSAADGVYAAARPKLIQIRTLVAAAGRQSTIGSGFLVSRDGLAVTNYHVVAQFALEPATYQLEYTAPDGVSGKLQLLAFDVANDLAVVRTDQPAKAFFEFDARALRGALPKGEYLYSMGNPLDLGFTIVGGTYNGLVERSYGERIHFSGAVNPGMSGGPTVTGAGRVVGVNVSKRFGAELVSFLVPARFALALVTRAAGAEPLSPAQVRGEIQRQLAEWQAGFYRALGERGFRTTAFGPYLAPESQAPWFTCWARTNAEQVPKARASLHTTSCNADNRMFIANDLSTGQVRLEHAFARSLDLNPFQFVAFVSQQFSPSWSGMWSRKRHTRQRCHEDFLAAAETEGRPPVRAVWCARAYREFEGIYDVTVILVTQDRADQALVSKLTMQGVGYDNAVALAKRFMGEVRWGR
jgi:S1-C subfamily serine protease